MRRTLYRPSRRQAVCLALIAAAALGYGFVMRYGLVENSSIGIACGATRATWICASRNTAISLFTPQAFGGIALVAALLNLLRPSIALWAITLATGGAGIVLYNTALSALAAALLIVSLARPEPEAN
jgi:hypothetical protein